MSRGTSEALFLTMSSASWYRIPFFVAAPVTTIDVETADGAQIRIEQRDATELTHFQGHRVAAEGIGVCLFACTLMLNAPCFAAIHPRFLSHPSSQTSASPAGKSFRGGAITRSRVLGVGVEPLL